MTILVYDGKHLYADRKCYSGGEYTFESIKLKTARFSNATFHYAFSGSFADCAIGDKVVESNFDPEVCRWAYERLGHDNLQDTFYGIVVETFYRSTEHNVYLVNYAGDKCLMIPDQLIVVGANREALITAVRTVNHFCDKNVAMEDLIRFAYDGSSLTQKGFVIDRVNLRTGKYEEV